MEDDIFADLLGSTGMKASTTAPPKPAPLRTTKSQEVQGSKVPQQDASEALPPVHSGPSEANGLEGGCKTGTLVTVTREELEDLISRSVQTAIDNTFSKFARSLRTVLEDMGRRIESTHHGQAELKDSMEDNKNILKDLLHQQNTNFQARFTNLDLAVKEVDRGVQAIRDKAELQEAQAMLAKMSGDPVEKKVSAPVSSSNTSASTAPSTATNGAAFQAPTTSASAPGPSPAPGPVVAPVPAPQPAAVPPQPQLQQQPSGHAPGAPPMPHVEPQHAGQPAPGYPSYSQQVPALATQVPAAAAPPVVAPSSHDPYHPSPPPTPYQPPAYSQAPPMAPPMQLPPPHGMPLPPPPQYGMAPPTAGMPPPPYMAGPPPPSTAAGYPSLPSYPPPPVMPSPSFPSSRSSSVSSHAPGAPPAPAVRGPPGSGTASRSVPLDQIISDIAAMGFERHKVMQVVSSLQNSGQSVDLNVILDRLTRGAY